MTAALASQWITANAGSGKTYTLTERVVRLLLLGVPPERIVCITYTKAAASEMRVRVLDRLRALLLADDVACHAQIEKLLDVPATEEMLAHARGLFGQVLDSPSGGLVLTTIHGFCQNILRRFPLEAGIAPHFTVLEEQAAQEVLRNAKYALLNGLESADVWFSDALSLIGARGGEFRFETLAADIIAKRRLWDDIWRAQSPESLRTHLFALHGLADGCTRDGLGMWLCSALSAADEATLRAQLPVMLAHKKKTEQKYAQGLATWLEADESQRMSQIPALGALFLTAEGTLRADVKKLEGYDLATPIAQLSDAVLRYRQQVAALACAEESFAVAVLAHALLDLYRQGKEAIHALDYDDLIDHTLRLVREPETLGWVMSKLDHRIDHLLIDEAQDNSSAQWQLAQVLVEELIASNDGVGSANQPRSLLVVGDEKQSIYSFQGAAPEQFQRYRQVFQATLSGSPSPLGARALANSYRSAEAVLRLVNHLCTAPEMVAALGVSEAHQLIRDQAAGLVALYPPIIAPEKITREAMVIPTSYARETTVAESLAEEIATTVHRWLVVEKRALVSAGRALQPSDILILVHRRKPLVAPLIRALQRRGVPVAGIDRLVLSEHLAVRDLLALMAWCDNAEDDLALAQVLRSPLVGWSDEQLRAAAYGRTGSLWAEISLPWLARVRTWRMHTPYDFLTQVLEVSGCRRAFARRFGEEVHEVLDELKAQAAAMPEPMPPTLAEFHDWLSSSARTIKREQDSGVADHVRIMTVHGAKGLEAPVVILADTVSVPTTQHERIFTVESAHGQRLPVLAMSDDAKAAPRLDEAKERKAAKLREEYQRLLYVAATRARDELHVFGSASKKGDVKKGAWYSAIESAMRAIGAEDADGVMRLRDARDVTPEQRPVHAATRTPPLPIWATTTPAATYAPTLASLAPSQLMAAQPSPYAAQAAQAAHGAKERGVRIHRVLELLSATSTAQDITALVEAVAPDWDAVQQKKATQEINALFDQQRWLWQHPRMAEASIAGTIEHEGALIPINGQIDLLIETPEAVMILDYKTGAHIPTQPADVSSQYLLQLKVYKALVAQLYPTKPVRCGIVWTAAPSLMWLDGEVENLPFPQAAALINSALAA